MGIESFHYVRPALGNGEHVKPLSQAWGDPVTDQSRAGASLREGVAPAGLFSTAPYVDPGQQIKPGGVTLGKIEAIHDAPDAEPDPPERQGRCMANDDTCKGWATHAYWPYCNPHGRLLAGEPVYPEKGE